MMARFRVLLIGASHSLEVDFPVGSTTELGEIASRVRFLDGHMAEPDQDGIYPGVLIPTCRLQLVTETN